MPWACAHDRGVTCCLAQLQQCPWICKPAAPTAATTEGAPRPQAPSDCACITCVLGHPGQLRLYAILLQRRPPASLRPACRRAGRPCAMLHSAANKSLIACQHKWTQMCPCTPNPSRNQLPQVLSEPVAEPHSSIATTPLQSIPGWQQPECKLDALQYHYAMIPGWQPGGCNLSSTACLPRAGTARCLQTVTHRSRGKAGVLNCPPPLP